MLLHVRPRTSPLGSLKLVYLELLVQVLIVKSFSPPTRTLNFTHDH